MRYFGKIVLTLSVVMALNVAYGQKAKKPAKPAKNWMLEDYKSKKVYGMSVKTAYALLKKNKMTSKTVIVAVIDSGVDHNHEDLKDVMWKNPGETAGNGVDDDKNGYIDDVYGWNFIGGKGGTQVDFDNLELTRLVRELKEKYEKNAGPFTDKYEQFMYDQYVKAKAELEGKQAEMGQGDMFISIYESIKHVPGEFKNKYNAKKFDIKSLDKIKLADTDKLKADYEVCKGYMQMFKMNDLNQFMEVMVSAKDYFEGQKYQLDVNFDPRSEKVGDNYSDSKEKFYGNNEVIGPDASHGTHVAGIIAAKRGNKIGIDGIADNVQIMAIRVVPNGDERDKDVANGIRYAVDNGARIINMSFGKKYVKDKKVVDDAVKYAESKGVLLVHAAGNDGENIDTEIHYPSRRSFEGYMPNNWLEIGAMGYEPAPNSVGDFSNYGIGTVDVFAPGVQIYSTIPGNKYAFFDGTSMAAPSTSGVAAVIMSYFPNLTAAQVRDIIVKSSAKHPELNVIKPGTEKESVAFSSLSASGGVVNLYNAIIMAMEISKK